jgi:general secretion pathway protein A
LLTAVRSDHLSACEEYYGLTAHPFSLTPDPRFVYPSRSHSHAFGEVTEALKRREGIIVVTGDIGTGKTVLCRALLDTFEPRIFLSVILDPLLAVDDLLQQVLADFGLIAKADPAAKRRDIDRHQLIATLQRFLTSLSPVNAHAVIMIDEAQHLAPEVLEEIRLLSNIEANDAKLLQIVLVGQPDLDELLRRPNMQQLSQRVARRVALHPLSPEEVREYVERRLSVAAGAGDSLRHDSTIGAARFAPSALQALAGVSRGIPRVINTVANQALEIGFERQTRDIDDRMVAEAAKRLQLSAPAESRLPSRTVLGAAAALILAVVAIGWWWSSSSASSAVSAPPAASTARVTAAPSAVSAPGSAAPQAGPPAAARTAPPGTPPATAPTGLPATAPATANEAARSVSSRPADAPRAPAAPAKPSVGDKAGGFEITVAAFRTAQRAEEVADAIGQSGLPVLTRADSTGTWHLIVVGPLRSSEEADFAQKTLARQGFSGTKVSPIARSVPQ